MAFIPKPVTCMNLITATVELCGLPLPRQFSEGVFICCIGLLHTTGLASCSCQSQQPKMLLINYSYGIHVISGLFYISVNVTGPNCKLAEDAV